MPPVILAMLSSLAEQGLTPDIVKMPMTQFLQGVSVLTLHVCVR